MTESELKELIKIETMLKSIVPVVDERLAELEQYREIGTLEECRAAVEKRKPKKPIVKARIPYCPCCGEIATTDTGDSYMDYRVGYCLECGQKIDLEE